MTDSLLTPTRPLVSPDLPHVHPGVRPMRTAVLSRLRHVAAWGFRRYYDIQLHGFENVPSGPVVLAANHLAVLDGPLLVAMTRRLTFAMAKNELFTGWVGSALELVGQIPVDQYGIDTEALDRSIQVLREGHAFGIFPEGGRGDGEMTQIKGGVAYLAMVTGAPIVPVAILGSRQPGQDVRALPPRGATIHIVYGEPIEIPQVAWPRTRAHVAATTADLQRRFVDHLAYAQSTCGMRLPGAPAPLAVTDR